MTKEVVRSLDEITTSLDAHLRRGAEEWIAAGKDLIEAKKQLKSGIWIKWLEARGLTQQAANKLMHIARSLGTYHRHDGGPFPALSKETLALLAAPSTPEPVREEILTRAELGEKISLHAARQIVNKAQLSTPREPEWSPAIPDNLPRIARFDTESIEEDISKAFWGKNLVRLSELLEAIGSSRIERDDPAFKCIIHAIDRCIEDAGEWRRKLLSTVPNLRRVK